jgi:hypothetical protein
MNQQFNFQVDVTEQIDIQHNIPPELADQIEFENGNVSIQNEDSSTSSDTHARGLTPSEKIEQAREKYSDEGQEDE